MTHFNTWSAFSKLELLRFFHLLTTYFNYAYSYLIFEKKTISNLGNLIRETPVLASSNLFKTPPYPAILKLFHEPIC
jgi:hypothetical protein